MSRKIDLAGKTFGDRTVIHQVPMPGCQAHWLVRCRCGMEDVVPSQRLRSSGGSSCRRCGRQKVDKVVHLTGRRFGHWSVGARAPTPEGRTAAFWNVICDCGGASIVLGSDLTSGHSSGCRSCGHLKYDYRVNLTAPDWCWLMGLFHGDGNTSFVDGGVVNFACAHAGRRQVVKEALVSVGIVKGVGETRHAVLVYSKTLASDLARFKVSGRGQEQWMFPEEPHHWGEWAAGLLDADGCVSLRGQVTFYQKPHGGLDFLASLLESWEIPHTRSLRENRPLEEIRVLKSGMPVFRERVRPRFALKAERLAA